MMRKSTLGWMGFIAIMALIMQIPMWIFASDPDITEVRASFVSLALGAGGGIVVMVRELMKYHLELKVRPADVQRRTHTVAGIPIVDDSER